MAQDIRKLFEEEQKVSNHKMPKGHDARFLQKLDEEIPVSSIKKQFSFLNIAASVIIILGLSYGAYKYFNSSINNNIDDTVVENTNSQDLKTLGDISPDLKKVEDYYVANINLELSKIKLTPENKELFDSYVKRLEDLNKEYDVLSIELTQDGPNERTIDALINNLKLRLNLLYRFKEQLKDLNDSELNQVV
jgi:hypothetical protein